jgi:hypothetical protein
MEFIITEHAFSSGLFIVKEYKIYQLGAWAGVDTEIDPHDFSMFHKSQLQRLDNSRDWFFNKGITAQGVIRNEFFPNDHHGRAMALKYIEQQERKKTAAIRMQVSTELPINLKLHKADKARNFLARL